MVWLARGAGSGLVAWATPRLLLALGVPLDRWVIQLAEWLTGVSGALQSEEALWVIAIVFGLVLFGIEAWWRPVETLFRRLLGGKSSRAGGAEAVVPEVEPLQTERPDMSLNELFLHICPEVLDNNDLGDWSGVGDEIRDRLCEGALRAWGRPFPQDGALRMARPSSHEIPKEYWRDVDDWTYFFFMDEPNMPDTAVRHMSPQPPYGDIRVNKADVLKIWPKEK